jgi:AcrR family transcriptional regulator
MHLGENGCQPYQKCYYPHIEAETPMSDAAPGRAKSSPERLLEAGKRLFAERGFEQTTTAAIAREAASSESQLVKFYENKEGLLRAIFEDGWNRLGFVFSAAAVAEKPEEKLRVIFELIVRALQEDRELRDLMLFEGRRVRSHTSQILLTAGYFRLVQEVEKIVSELLDRSGLKHQMRAGAVASALIGMLESMLRDQAISERQRGQAMPSADEIRTMFHFIVGALSVRSTAI